MQLTNFSFVRSFAVKAAPKGYMVTLVTASMAHAISPAGPLMHKAGEKLAPLEVEIDAVLDPDILQRSLTLRITCKNRVKFVPVAMLDGKIIPDAGLTRVKIQAAEVLYICNSTQLQLVYTEIRYVFASTCLSYKRRRMPRFA
jgi:hypothetical protein